MTPGARAAAAIEVIDRIAEGTPAEKALLAWARGARYAGSKDRAAVRDFVFDVLRRWRSTAVRGGAESGRARLLGLLREQGLAPEELFTGDGYAPSPLSPEEQASGEMPDGAAALDLPEWLWPAWERSLGEGAQEAARLLRERAPVFLRLNSRKTSKNQAIESLSSSGVLTEPVANSESALRVVEGARRIQASAAYQQGLVELQDASSQVAIASIKHDNPLKIIDYCAGGGGKSLALAARYNRSIAAYDAAPDRMRDLPTRAKRAGAVIDILKNLNNIDGYDLVLTDVPCSGSGTWRRAPDGKWRLTPAQFEALLVTQAQILREAARCVAPSGRLVYMTCSVLDLENERQIADFLASHRGWRKVQQRRWPISGDGDGFYMAELARGGA